MRDAIRETAKSGDPELDVSEHFIIKSTIDGDGNSFYVKHWDDTKQIKVSISEESGADFDDNFDVKIIDQNDQTNTLHLQKEMKSDLDKTTYNIYEFEPEFLDSGHNLNMSFTPDYYYDNTKKLSDNLYPENDIPLKLIKSL